MVPAWGGRTEVADLYALSFEKFWKGWGSLKLVDTVEDMGGLLEQRIFGTVRVVVCQIVDQEGTR